MVMNEAVCTIHTEESKSTMNIAGSDTAKECLLPKCMAPTPRAKKMNPERREKGKGANGISIAILRKEMVLQCFQASKSAIDMNTRNSQANTGAWYATAGNARNIPNIVPSGGTLYATAPESAARRTTR